MTAESLARLRALLEAERAALRAGEIERLDEFLTGKEELMKQLAAEGVDPQDPEVAVLRAFARSNAAMCDAAARGLRAAIDRFLERTRVAGQLDTYDRTGQRRSFAAVPPTAPRRA